METANAREKRAQQQRGRRLARRVCGYCGSPAALMLEWGGSRPIPICGGCNSRLQGSWRELQIPENEWTEPEKAWSGYRPAGFWCDLQERRAGGEVPDPCDDCILMQVESQDSPGRSRCAHGNGGIADSVAGQNLQLVAAPVVGRDLRQPVAPNSLDVCTSRVAPNFWCTGAAQGLQILRPDPRRGGRRKGAHPAGRGSSSSSHARTCPLRLPREASAVGAGASPGG